MMDHILSMHTQLDLVLMINLVKKEFNVKADLDYYLLKYLNPLIDMLVFVLSNFIYFYILISKRVYAFL
jgi:hypothetical protein